ncbi:uncharacterized protein LOC123505769 [Portunus trituberculatus]|uniref:uncharacterized protein LOC123505769 n=1 Tax=Portunus trituberculatus TaxID=210409 RepID=UPI001E1CC1F1|nr:uncharacterized protein LOC123505769 [Portunus trituberculatus]
MKHTHPRPPMVWSPPYPYAALPPVGKVHELLTSNFSCEEQWRSPSFLCDGLVATASVLRGLSFLPDSWRRHRHADSKNVALSESSSYKACTDPRPVLDSRSSRQLVNWRAQVQGAGDGSVCGYVGCGYKSDGP